jgi:hypothetical protein
MDPDFNGQIENAYIQVISTLEPLDAKVLSYFYEYRNEADEKKDTENIASALEMDKKHIEISVNKLMSLGLLSNLILNETTRIQGHPSLSGSLPYVTPFGTGFIKACIDEEPA